MAEYQSTHGHGSSLYVSIVSPPPSNFSSPAMLPHLASYLLKGAPSTNIPLLPAYLLFSLPSLQKKMFVRPASLALAFVLFSASVAAPTYTDDNVGNLDDTTAVSGGDAGAGSSSDFGPAPNPDVKCMLGTPTGFYDADFYRSLKCPSDFFCVPVAVLPTPPTSDPGTIDTRLGATVIPTTVPSPAQYCLDKCDCDQTPGPDSFSPSLLCFKMQSDFCDFYTCPDGNAHLPFVKYEPTDATTLYPPGFFSTAVGHSVGHASGIGAQSNSHVKAHAGGSVAESTSNAKSLFGDVSTSNDAKAIGRRGESPVQPSTAMQ